MDNKSVTVNSSHTVATSSALGITSVAMNNYIAKHKAVIDQLQASNVNIFQVGDEFRFVIPSDKLFEQRTSTLSNQGYGILNNVIELVKDQRKFATKIAAYTDNTNPSEISLALTRQQAQVVSRYLWSQDINSRFLSALEYASSQSIANNKTEIGRALNRRLEISLKLITDNTID